MAEDDGMTVHVCRETTSPKPDLVCPAKHTKYQPGLGTSGPWECPKCGASANEGFIIDETAEGANEKCALLHTQDICRCEACGYMGMGYNVARALAKRHNMVTCPHCGGKGMVKG